MSMPDLIRERYINPYTDFGFKKLFGTEMNKDLLISFLNALFHGTKKEITDVQYLNGEHLGDGYGDRRAVFDVYCMTAGLSLRCRKPSSHISRIGAYTTLRSPYVNRA